MKYTSAKGSHVRGGQYGLKKGGMAKARGIEGFKTGSPKAKNYGPKKGKKK